jgi:hypothetical protein
LFVASDKEIEEAIGKQAYFGEILGKHSEVYGNLEKNDFKKIEVDSDAIEKLIPHLGMSWSGYNPLDYIEYTCDKCEEDNIRADEMWKIEDDGKICWSCKPEEEK